MSSSSKSDSLGIKTYLQPAVESESVELPGEDREWYEKHLPLLQRAYHNYKYCYYSREVEFTKLTHLESLRDEDGLLPSREEKKKRKIDCEILELEQHMDRCVFIMSVGRKMKLSNLFALLHTLPIAVDNRGPIEASDTDKIMGHESDSSDSEIESPLSDSDEDVPSKEEISSEEEVEEVQTKDFIADQAIPVMEVSVFVIFSWFFDDFVGMIMYMTMFGLLIIHWCRQKISIVIWRGINGVREKVYNNIKNVGKSSTEAFIKGATSAFNKDLGIKSATRKVAQRVKTGAMRVINPIALASVNIGGVVIKHKYLVAIAGVVAIIVRKYGGSVLPSYQDIKDKFARKTKVDETEISDFITGGYKGAYLNSSRWLIDSIVAVFFLPLIATDGLMAATRAASSVSQIFKYVLSCIQGIQIFSSLFMSQEVCDKTVELAETMEECAKDMRNKVNGGIVEKEIDKLEDELEELEDVSSPLRDSSKVSGVKAKIRDLEGKVVKRTIFTKLEDYKRREPRKFWTIVVLMLITSALSVYAVMSAKISYYKRKAEHDRTWSYFVFRRKGVLMVWTPWGVHELSKFIPPYEREVVVKIKLQTSEEHDYIKSKFPGNILSYCIDKGRVEEAYKIYRKKGKGYYIYDFDKRTEMEYDEEKIQKLLKDSKSKFVFTDEYVMKRWMNDPDSGRLYDDKIDNRVIDLTDLTVSEYNRAMRELYAGNDDPLGQTGDEGNISVGGGRRYNKNGQYFDEAKALPREEKENTKVEEAKDDKKVTKVEEKKLKEGKDEESSEIKQDINMFERCYKIPCDPSCKKVHWSPPCTTYQCDQKCGKYHPPPRCYNWKCDKKCGLFHALPRCEKENCDKKCGRYHKPQRFNPSQLIRANNNNKKPIKEDKQLETAFGRQIVPDEVLMRSIGLIKVTYGDGNQALNNFCILAGKIITVKHLFTTTQPVKEVVLRFIDSDWMKVEPKEIVMPSQKDYVVITAARISNGRPSLKHQKIENIGQNAPLKLPVLVYNHTKEEVKYVALSGTLTKVDGYDVYYHMATEAGMCGAPVVSEYGTVIGIHGFGDIKDIKLNGGVVLTVDDMVKISSITKNSSAQPQA